ncbi:AAA family ATPase [Thalassotalea ponticola]|uniref:AAA family ATPase n=1 Tax=Thalassotalea ponticola TaxID=1523392 RepID=UPI0025B3C6CF|nr:AAA family ATPase [Thalassotalea ponticola]MDN3653361.1 AAA family ATPase [Thalassotalea ponticola]
MKILVFGNSGSGKTTLSTQLAEAHALSHLDLDSLAWLPSTPPERKPLVESANEIKQFMAKNQNWVIEGCYADLLELTVSYATEIIYLDLPIEQCINNAKNRPWEPSKYVSKKAQDANLEMLINWISRYNNRQDCFSRSAHENLYHGYSGKKTLYTCNSSYSSKVLPLQN